MMNSPPTEHFAILGSGAVGGYYGAKLARAGHRVSFLARGAHLAAMRERGLQICSPLGDFTVSVEVTDDPSLVGPVDVVLFTVKTYDNDTALPMLAPLVDDRTVVLTLQNGVDSSKEVAGVVGEPHVLGGATYIATGLSAPGLIEQTGTHRKIVFGEVFGERSRVSDRVATLGRLMEPADIEIETVVDARPRLWEKLIYLCPFAAFTGAARSPIGKLWSDSGTQVRFMAAVAEVEAVARAEGVDVSVTVAREIREYMDALPAATRSSMLIDLLQGKRIEVEALQGTIVRRGQALGVATPIVTALYEVLRPYARGK